MSNVVPNLSNFLAPRHWPTWVGLGITRAVVALPHGARLALGARLGKTLGQWVASRYQTVDINLGLCFPTLDALERRQLVQRHLEALGMGMMETAMSWWLDDAALYPLAEVKGEEHLRTAQEKGRGVILFTGHFTTLELAAHLLAIHVPFHAMYRPLRNPLADAIVLRARCRRSPRVYARDDIRAMVRSLGEGAAVWYAMDQDQGGAHAVFAPFFGVPAATITTTSRLARITGAAVVPYCPVRLPDGRYRIHIFPALADFPGDPAEDAARLNALLEGWIREAPEQYLWVHRRFKTRPPGSPDLYHRSP
ncbi:Lipid A biosynthesis lauroyltransferase [Gammaproteobacteria bacterium]